ncbi:hypothetical protein RUM43_011684 [Polyplax serrata]|uniref:ABC1 atypical kinase-like domain-containing protein n=1 Tax=Polyplax serrata TaxID=468196 RepID=A0AAN8RTR3_POLSC
MTKNLLNDLKAGCRALDLVLRESIKHHHNTLDRIVDNSSVRAAVNDIFRNCRECIHSITTEDLSRSLNESLERASMVPQSLKVYVTTSHLQTQSNSKPELNDLINLEQGVKFNIKRPLPKGVNPEDLQVSELHQKDKELIEKLEKEFEEKLKAEATYKNDTSTGKQGSSGDLSVAKGPEYIVKDKTKLHVLQPSVRKYVPKQKLNPEARQRRVPSTRLGRMVSFGSLAAGLSIGALAEATRRTIGLTSVSEQSSSRSDPVFLTEANAERIVSTLCRVRGAALKIGQIFSIQDNTIISPVLQKAFERVRHSADFMPNWQVESVLQSELGIDWRNKLDYFEEKPFAAASIGQVHYVRLKDGKECAMKIQYPGVAQGIESDINNLIGVLKIWNVFPRGLFIDNLVEVAKKELAWEVNYIREAECTRKFKLLLSPYQDYTVPDIIDELSTNQILTSSLIHGLPVDKCIELEEEHRQRIAMLVMQLCLREVFEFRCMQTDPNWSNFFYDPNSRKLLLLDFGATRTYDLDFIKKYIEVIKAAADGDREKVLLISKDMGFLTGYESKSMSNAHVDTVMILAEVFSSEKAFDFGHQNTTQRVQKLVPTIVAERLCPPPEEIYSLHRKLSGVFLLCTKLKVKISCREMFLRVYEKFKEETAQ